MSISAAREGRCNRQIRCGRIILSATVTLCCLLQTGCMRDRYIDAIPVARVPREILKVQRRDDLKEISLLRLRQDTPENYMLGPGDTVGVWVRGVHGTDDESPPIHYPEDGNRPPAVGIPYPIREDGTISLPIIDPINVEGMSLVEATNAIRMAYIYPEPIIREGEESVTVSLIRQRKTRVMVIREEAGGVEGVSKRGTGQIVDLPAYENDVLRALSMTGGLPGTDAKNEILIYRGLYEAGVDADSVLSQICEDDCQDNCFCNEAPLPDPPSVTRIPLRYNPAAPPEFDQQDVILEDGDIVIIRSRDRETFYTAGVLGGGEYQLPRDKDLDILGAIAMIGGPLGETGTGVGALSGGAGGGGGFGGGGGRGRGGQQQFCQPTDAIIIRELPCGSQISMRVNLNRALQNPRERVIIQPGDVIVVRYTLGDEIGNVLLNLFQFNFLWGLGGNAFN